MALVHVRTPHFHRQRSIFFHSIARIQPRIGDVQAIRGRFPAALWAEGLTTHDDRSIAIDSAPEPIKGLISGCKLPVSTMDAAGLLSRSGDQLDHDVWMER